MSEAPSAALDSVPPNFPHPIVLGIDPGTAVLGYGAIVVLPGGPRLLACGTLSAPRKLAVAARLGRLRVALDELLVRLRPTILVVERAFAAKNIQSALRIGEGRGVVLGCAGGLGLEVVELAPAVAKKTLVGHGGAAKEQVANMVSRELGRPDLAVALDATDALALALCFVYKQRAGTAKFGRQSGAARAV